VLLLASKSRRRAELLHAAGIPFEVVETDVDETPGTGETPSDYVRRLAEDKARAAFAMRPDATVLGADTIVVVDGRMLGKPTDDSEAVAMLHALSGRVHEVLTGVAVLRPQSGATVAVACTKVWFVQLTGAEIDWYVRSGEPMDKAGAYAVQGLASRFIERLDGSYSNVVGLPIALVYRLLRELPEISRNSAI
jgi:septum formation protein